MIHSTATLCVWTHSFKKIEESKAINGSGKRKKLKSGYCEKIFKSNKDWKL